MVAFPVELNQLCFKLLADATHNSFHVGQNLVIQNLSSVLCNEYQVGVHHENAVPPSSQIIHRPIVEIAS